MKIVIAGGSGFLGRLLSHWFSDHDCVVLSRAKPRFEGPRWVVWDGHRLDTWLHELDGADVLINLAGRSVDCRYTAANRREIFDSRVQSTAVLGQALQRVARPPKLWLQMSTATIYAHNYGQPHDEYGGVLGGREINAPETWRFSIDVAMAWEAVANQVNLGETRLVLMRTAMVMDPAAGAFTVLAGLTGKGLGGRVGDGAQYISWIHGIDFCRAVAHVIDHEAIQGPVIICSPEALPQSAFMTCLRRAMRCPFGLPAPAWLLEIATFFLRTESELILKSRRVFPAKLMQSGFSFHFPEWSGASRDLVARRKQGVPRTSSLPTAAVAKS